MEVFSLDEYARTFTGQTLYYSTPHTQMTEYHAWKFASVLFERAISGEPDLWA